MTGAFIPADPGVVLAALPAPVARATAMLGDLLSRCLGGRGSE